MAEYNLANTFINFEQKSFDTIDFSSYRKIPFTIIAGLGGAISELIPAFRKITTTITTSADNIYQAYNPLDESPISLQYESHQIAGAKVGSVLLNGKYNQAAFKPLAQIDQVVETTAGINPAVVCMAIAFCAMDQKLNKIEKTQQTILRFLESDKKADIEGTMNFLLEIFNNYKFNWDKPIYRASTHTKTQDIKQESEHNILFYRDKIESILGKKTILPNRTSVRRNMDELIDCFGSYRQALYLYSFSTFLEVLLLENYEKNYLDSVISKIRDYSYSYSEIYTDSYTWLLDTAKKAVETGVMKEVSTAAKEVGQFINRIPIIKRGRLDENLIAAGERLGDYKNNSIDEMLYAFTTMKNSEITQFSDLLQTISHLHNTEQEVLFDKDNLYVKTVI